MTKVKFFNKGLLKGKLVKSELVEYESRTGKNVFLSVEVDTGDSNKIKGTVFPTKKNPNKPKELKESFPIGSLVTVSGTVNEKEFETQSGRIGIDRSVNAFSITTLTDDTKCGATFIIQGIVDKMREVSDGIEIQVRYDETYQPEGKDEVTRSAIFTLTLPENKADLIDDLDVEVGCNAKFKGFIFNQLEFDDFGDIIGNVQMFQVAKIENVIPADELLEDEEELPF